MLFTIVYLPADFIYYKSLFRKSELDPVLQM